MNFRCALSRRRLGSAMVSWLLSIRAPIDASLLLALGAVPLEHFASGLAQFASKELFDRTLMSPSVVNAMAVESESYRPDANPRRWRVLPEPGGGQVLAQLWRLLLR